MGGSFSTNAALEAQNVSNSSIQTSKNYCESVCGNDNKNVNVIIQNSTNVNIDFQQTCSVLGSSCTVKNSLDSSITNMLEATAKQTVVNVSNFLEYNKSNNFTSITQNIRNNMAQLISNTCKNVSQNTNENIYVYVGNAKAVKVDFAQSGTVSNANCAYDNAAKITVYNSETAKVTQSVKNIGILGIIAAIIVLIIGAFVLFSLIGSLKNKDGNKDGNGQEQPQNNTSKQPSVPPETEAAAAAV